MDLNPQFFPTPNTTGTGEVYHTVDEFISLPTDCETVFSGQSNPLTIADIYSGALYFVIIAKDTPPAGYGISLAAGSVARLRYTD